MQGIQGPSGSGGSGGTSVTVSTTAPSSPSEGALWVNSETGELNAYYAGAWADIYIAGVRGIQGLQGLQGIQGPGAQGATGYSTFTYTANGTTTTFSATSGMNVDNVIVTENGVVQTPTTDYTISGNNVVFSVAPRLNTKIQIRVLGGGSGGASVTVSTTAPVSPNEGALWVNSETGELSAYYGNSWAEIFVSGTTNQDVFTLNKNTISSSVTIPSGSNAVSVGPIYINSGTTITIPQGSKWVIL